MKTKEEIKKCVIELLPLLSFDAHGFGNGRRESCMNVFGKVDAYLDVLGIKVQHFGTHEDIVLRIKSEIDSL